MGVQVPSSAPSFALKGSDGSRQTCLLKLKVKKTMKIAVLKEEGLTRELEVTVPAATLQKKMESELLAYGQKVKIDGFRKGKVPFQVLKSRYGQNGSGQSS
jgi:hypothetical protein